MKEKILDPVARGSYALSKYGFITRDIQVLLGNVLPVASDRTIKKRSGVEDNVLGPGRARGSTKLKPAVIPHLLFALHADPQLYGDNLLHLLEIIKGRFKLTPRQLQNWASKQIRRGGMTLRPCLHCKKLFPSMSSGDRVGPCCQGAHRKALREAASAIDDPDLA